MSTATAEAHDLVLAHLQHNNPVMRFLCHVEDGASRPVVRIGDSE